MFSITNIINSRLFYLLPKFICDKILSRIIYFEKTNKKKLPDNNYQLSINDSNFKEKIKYYNKININKLHYTIPHLPTILKILFKDKKINLLDYGAGDIKNFFYLNNNLEKLNYFYKDQNQIENLIKKEIFLKKFANFKIFKRENKNQINIIHFGSSFQYIENIQTILNDINVNKIKYIIISGIIIFKKGNSKRFVCLQKNIPNKIMYLYFYNKKFLLNFFKKRNFKLISIVRNSTDTYMNWNNFQHNHYEYCDIIFKYDK